jgi:hypothetical protein
VGQFQRCNGSLKLSCVNLYCCGFEFPSQVLINSLLNIAAPYLRSISNPHPLEQHVIDQLDVSRLECVKLGTQDDATVSALSKTGSKLSIIRVELNSATPEQNHAFLQNLASTSSAQLVEFSLHVSFGFNMEDLLPRIAEVTKCHSTTLQYFLFAFPLSDLQHVLTWLHLPSLDSNGVSNRLYEAFGIPAHRVRLQRDRPLFWTISSLFKPEPSVALWKTSYNHIYGLEISPSRRAQNIADILSQSLQSRLRFFDGTILFLNWFIPDVVEPLVSSSEEIEYEISLNLLGLLMFCSGLYQSPHLEKTIDSLLERHKDDTFRVISIVLQHWAPKETRKLAISVLLEHPVWNKLIINHCNSKDSVLLHEMECSVPICDILLPLLALQLDLRTKNEYGITIADNFLRLETVETSALIETILLHPTLLSQLLENITAPQICRLYVSYPFRHWTSLRELLPTRVFQVVDSADSDRVFKCVADFYFIWVEGNTRPLLRNETIRLDFVELYKANVPHRASSTEDRFRRYLEQQDPFDTVSYR